MAVNTTTLIERAREALLKAYAPYSKHPVGAALVADDGSLYAGCNIENAAYPLGQCAEATAIGSMVLAGNKRISHIVIVGPGEQACTPCGGCRQKIREFSGPDGVAITICNNDGDVLLETTIAELLPHAFGPDNVQETNR